VISCIVYVVWLCTCWEKERGVWRPPRLSFLAYGPNDKSKWNLKILKQNQLLVIHCIQRLELPEFSDRFMD